MEKATTRSHSRPEQQAEPRAAGPLESLPDGGEPPQTSAAPNVAAAPTASVSLASSVMPSAGLVDLSTATSTSRLGGEPRLSGPLILPVPEAAIPVAALRGHERLERLVNVALAGAALALGSPLLLLIGIAVKLTSPGPVLYRQPRVGIDRRGVRLHARRRSDRRWHLWARFLELYDDQRTRDLGGSVFMIYKFRTMREDAERETGAVWAVRNDPRSTPIGAFLRKYRLDELPQLVNVLRGDMNIVGPRPERPSIFARLREEIEEYPERQRAKPGITGWAQINLLYDSCVDDVRRKVRYDLEYLRRRSIARDLAIMARTLPSVIFRRRGW